MTLGQQQTAEQVLGQRLKDLRAAREFLAIGPWEDQVARQWWEPHAVYLLHFPADGCYKVGLTRDRKRPQLLCRGRGLVVETYELANRYAAFVLESHVWFRTAPARVDPPVWAYKSGRTEYWRDSLAVPPLAEMAIELSEDRALPAWDHTIFAQR